MKLRRAMAAAAATAAIAPIALLSAPAAFAEEPSTPPPSTTATESAPESTPPATTPPASTPPASTPASTPPASTPESTPPSSTTATPTTAAPTTSAPSETESPEPEPSECDNKVDVSMTGLPGKIAAGSGWHKFSLNVVNNSDSTLSDLSYLAGASPDKNGEELFKSKQVQLQAWNPDHKVWENVDEDGYAVGYVGSTDELKPDYEVDIPLRINVKSSAPVGAGFSLGATIYGDSANECFGYGEVAYKFQIVAAGTDTNGTKPQEGGEAPVTNTKPDSNTPKVNGSLAETGSSSALPVIGLVGGAAVVAGAGTIVVVRRRKAGADA